MYHVVAREPTTLREEGKEEEEEGEDEEEKKERERGRMEQQLECMKFLHGLQGTNESLLALDKVSYNEHAFIISSIHIHTLGKSQCPPPAVLQW